MVTAVVLVGIGYTNFSTNSGISNNTVQVSSTNNIGDVQLVSSSSAIVENDEKSKNEISNSSNNTVNNEVSNSVQNRLVDNENTLTNSVNTTVQTVSQQESKTEYFSKLKMERNDMYSKSLETYQNIVNNQSISNEQKSIAIQEIDKINNLQNSINVAEELIKLKGFEDVVIYSSNEKISVIVRSAALSPTQVAQIQNIVSKEFSANISDITISNKWKRKNLSSDRFFWFNKFHKLQCLEC